MNLEKQNKSDDDIKKNKFTGGKSGNAEKAVYHGALHGH